MPATPLNAAEAVKPPRLPLFRVLGFSTVALPVASLALTLGVYFPRYLASKLGLGLAAVGAAFTLVRLLDLAFDPMIAMVMDRTRTRFGRFRPWMLVALPVILVATWMLLMAERGVGQAFLVIWLLVLYCGLSTLGIAHSAWAANLATAYHERSRLFSLMAAVSLMGSLLVPLLAVLAGIGGVQSGQAGMIHATGWFVIVALPLAVVYVAVRTPERPSPQTRRERVGIREYWSLLVRPSMGRIIVADLALALGPGTTAALFLFFFTAAKGFTSNQTNLLLVIYIATSLVASPIWGNVATRFGKHRTLIASTVCYAIAQTYVVLAPRADFLLTVPGMLGVGVGGAGFILLVRAMVADVGDEVRLELGRERIGLLYALVSVTQKIGSAVSVGLSFLVLDLVGFKASLGPANTSHAIQGLEYCYLFAPVLFVLMGGGVFVGYRLDATRHAAIRAALEDRDAEQAGHAARGDVPLNVENGRSALPALSR